MKYGWLILVAVLGLAACDIGSDAIQRDQQEKILAEATAQTGMPAVKNFRERKLLKDIIELRDQSGLVTYTYTFSEMTGKYVFFCNSVGYPLPYATQYTNPEKLAASAVVLPQADPNGLFSPSSAEGSWVLCQDPNGKDVKAVYLEPRVISSPFKLPEQK
jgi:hypothetical protein